MVADLERRLVELRFIDGIEKVEHVPYSTGDEFWVRFNRPLNMPRLQGLVARNGLKMVTFAGIPSKLPRGLSEMLWNGVTHVITRKIGGFAKFLSTFGFEPAGIAKIALDLHSKQQIFIATEEAGVKLLYEFLGVNYIAPAPPPPPPKPVAPAKPPTPAATPPKPATPAPPPVAKQPAPAPTAPEVKPPAASPPPAKPPDQK